MNEIAEKELAGEIYLATTRLNELTARAAHQHSMRTDIRVETIHKVGDATHDHLTVTVYKQM